MRRAVPFLLLTAVAACAQPATRWEKAGADQQATAADQVSCRRAAQEEATSRFPPTFPRYVVSRRYAYYDDDRFFTENRLTDFCMRNKGYQQVTLPAPQAQAPASEK